MCSSTCTRNRTRPAPEPRLPIASASLPPLGSSAARNVGTTAGTVAAGNDTRFPVAIPQTAIANLNLGVLVLLTDAITALGTVQASYNTLLAELRTAGILLP
jgi:hypothetical protein